jgi:hypothetical protein
MKYLPGNIYSNSISGGVAEALCIALSGPLYFKLGLKMSYSILFAISCAGGLCILIIGTSSSAIWMSVFVMLAKGGVSGCFVCSYVSTTEVFPTLFCATALGICNFVARFLTIGAPLIAEQPEPIPMLCLISASAMAVVLI